MKMHCIVYFIWILSALTIVKCNVEHVGKNEINFSENDDQDDDETFNGINLSHDDRKINEAVPSSLELRKKKKCRKTKQACKDAGGKCQTKGDGCDGELLEGNKYCGKNKKCGCCVPGKQPCTRNGGGSCNDPSYRRKYTANGKPCVIGDIGLEDLILIRNECNYYFGAPEERCIFKDTDNTLLFALCGGVCDIPKKFIDDHMCSWCNNVTDALEFTKARGSKIKRNHVFKSGLNMGKKDWSYNSDPRAEQNPLQPICRLPEYVLTWYCQYVKRIDTLYCWEIGYYTGGGIAYGVEGHTAGHFLTTSLHEYQNN